MFIMLVFLGWKGNVWEGEIFIVSLLCLMWYRKLVCLVFLFW